MAHPSEYYIKHLLVFQEDGSRTAINDALKALGMASVDEPTYKRIHGAIRVPENFRPWDRADRRSVTWLKKERIFSMAHPDEAVAEMHAKVLNNPRLREDVETLILGNVQPREAARRLRKLEKPVSEIAIGEYRHYFWNPEVMGLSDWGEYLTKDDSKRTRATSGELAAVLKCGPDLALYKVGVAKEVDSKVVLDEVYRELYYTFQEVRHLPTDSKKVEMLGHLARGMARIDERRAAGDTALHETLKKFNKFKVHTRTKDIPSLFDIAPSGSVSNKSRTEILQTRETD